MDTISIEGQRYLVIREFELDKMRDESFREGMAKQYSEGHSVDRTNAYGKVLKQCVISDETVDVMAYSDDGYCLVLDIKFVGIDDPTKLALIVNDAYSLRNVLQEFIDYAELG